MIWLECNCIDCSFFLMIHSEFGKDNELLNEPIPRAAVCFAEDGESMMHSWEISSKVSQKYHLFDPSWADKWLRLCQQIRNLPQLVAMTGKLVAMRLVSRLPVMIDRLWTLPPVHHCVNHRWIGQATGRDTHPAMGSGITDGRRLTNSITSLQFPDNRSLAMFLILSLSKTGRDLSNATCPVTQQIAAAAESPIFSFKPFARIVRLGAITFLRVITISQWVQNLVRSSKNTMRNYLELFNNSISRFNLKLRLSSA